MLTPVSQGERTMWRRVLLPNQVCRGPVSHGHLFTGVNEVHWRGERIVVDSPERDWKDTNKGLL